MVSNDMGYRRYHIETRPAPERVPVPPRFRVRVRRHRLIGMVLRELVQYRGDLPVTLSRPCVYGVFGRPVGGLAPIEERCVGCLRCTMQYPEIVRIEPNPARERLGAACLTPAQVDTILYEARTGHVPVRGAGYRGRFGGDGWDGMWTDMSEIVRPTRDGIHGREYISTAVDIGAVPSHLQFDEAGHLAGPLRDVLSIPVPLLFDVPPPGLRSAPVLDVLDEAAEELETLLFVPVDAAVSQARAGAHVVPLIPPGHLGWLDRLPETTRMIALDGWDAAAFAEARRCLPGRSVCVRLPMEADVLEPVRAGASILHLTAGGRRGGRFAMDLIRDAHQRLVAAGVREEVTLIGSGGITMAEHVPKAIICGLDAVALDTALWVALQADLAGERIVLPPLEHDWAVQRLKNLVASWRDQLLEILGAMGLREVRRLRGEVGRCMFQEDLEREAFGEITGYAR